MRALTPVNPAIFLAISVLSFSAVCRAQVTLFESGKSYGKLCEEDNDEIGQKLGCNCNVPGRYKIADCSKLSIKLGPSSIQLPERINVSSQVQILDLTSNVIESINENTFYDIITLRELILAKNRITVVEGLNAPRLLRLDLSYNRITNLTASSFANLKRLQTLDLSHNQLTFIDSDAFSQLEFLSVLRLGYNELESFKNSMLDFPFYLHNMPYLAELDLTNGSLIDFPASAITNTTNLKKLVLANNHFSLLPEEAFEELQSLEELDLSGNLFVHLPPNGFASLGNLLTLKLDRLLVERIGPHTFANLSALKTLTCQYNFKLTHIDSMAFRGDRTVNTTDCNPQVVQLGHNRLTTFEFPLLKWSTLEDLELFGNAFECDCELQWVAEFHKVSPVDSAMLADTDFKCKTPEHLSGVPVFSADPEEMYCSSRTALLAGMIAIAVFSLILVLFCTLVVLSYFRILPAFFDKYLVVFRDSPSPHKYTRVQPKPNTVYEIGTGQPNPETPAEMDWDPSDIGPYGNRLS